MTKDGCLGLTGAELQSCSIVLDSVFTRGLHAVVQQFVTNTAGELAREKAPDLAVRMGDEIIFECALCRCDNFACTHVVSARINCVRL